MPFQKGRSGNPAGKPKGPNKVTKDIRTITQALFDAAYWKGVKARLDAGTLNPAIEMRLLAYANGEPKKVLAIEGEIGIRDKRRVLTQIPDSVISSLVAQDAFEETTSDDGPVN